MSIIEYSDPPYSAPILPVMKQDGKLILCVNYHKLNQVTLVQQEPMSNLENMFPRLSKASYFTKIELTRGYWQIKLRIVND